MVLKTGILSEQWYVGLLFPLYKKGGMEFPYNYKGITLLSAMRKLFHTIERLVTKYGIYGHCTVDDILIPHSIISVTINPGKTLYPAFIEFSKVFDYVTWKKLWFKLQKLGITGNMINVIRFMYANVKVKCLTMGQHLMRLGVCQ